MCYTACTVRQSRTCSPTTASLVMGTPSCHGGSCSRCAKAVTSLSRMSRGGVAEVLVSCAYNISSSASPIASVLGKACSSGDTPPVVSPVFFPPLVCANGHWEALSSSLGVGDPCTVGGGCAGTLLCKGSDSIAGAAGGSVASRLTTSAWVTLPVRPTCAPGFPAARAAVATVLLASIAARTVAATPKPVLGCVCHHCVGTAMRNCCVTMVQSVCTSDDSCASGLVCAGSICLTPYSTPSGRAPVVANVRPPYAAACLVVCSMDLAYAPSCRGPCVFVLRLTGAVVRVWCAGPWWYVRRAWSRSLSLSTPHGVTVVLCTVCVNPLTYLNHQPCSRTQTSGQPGYTCLCNSSSSSSGSYFPVYNTSSVISSFQVRGCVLFVGPAGDGCGESRLTLVGWQALEACKAKSGCTRGSKVCSAYHCLSELVKYEDLRLSLLISRYEGALSATRHASGRS